MAVISARPCSEWRPNAECPESQFMTTKRCTWVSMDDPLMLQYHDREWGVPVHDDRKHFEFLVLEAAQAGLSWSIVLKKREGYRRAFSEFDPEKVARYTEKRIQKLTLDPGDHSKPDENRSGSAQRAGVSRNSGGVRKFRRLLLAVRRWTTQTQPVEGDAGDSGDLT